MLVCVVSFLSRASRIATLEVKNNEENVFVESSHLANGGRSKKSTELHVTAQYISIGCDKQAPGVRATYVDNI